MCWSRTCCGTPGSPSWSGANPERLVAGAVLHRADDAVELSNTWTRGDEADEIHSMLRCAEVLYPDAPVVGYSRNETVRAYTGAGFSTLGPQLAWVREQ